MNKRKGMFIVFEGANGVGKSTVIDIMRRELDHMGHPTLVVSQPEFDGYLGKLARDMIVSGDHSPELCATIAAMARDYSIEHIIMPALNEGKIVLCDRFVDSTWAYQHKHASGDKMHIMRLEDNTLAKLQPDASVYVWRMPEEAVESVKGRTSKNDPSLAKDIAVQQDIQWWLRLKGDSNPWSQFVIESTAEGGLHQLARDTQDVITDIALDLTHDFMS